MPSKKRYRQYGALPYAFEGEEMRILLVTSRGTGRWIIPKGWPMRFLAPHKAAAQEAFEEAGVVGKAKRKSIGSYDYEKFGEDGSSIRLSVDVFPLNVDRLDEDWLESSQRRRQWFSQGEAAELVDEPALKSILRGYRPPILRSGEKLLEQKEERLHGRKDDGGNDHRRKNRKAKAEQDPDAVPLQKS